MPDVVAHSGLLKDTKVHVDDTRGAGRPVVLEGAPHSCNVSHADAFNRALLGLPTV